MSIRNKLIFVFVLALLTAVAVNAEVITGFSGITDMNGTYELSADVAIAEGFTPIGTEDAPFTGTFDGKGFTVTSGSYTAIFAYAENATIKNLNVENVTVKSDKYFGGIVGKADGSTVVKNCSFTGIINVDSEGLYSCGGGIAGFAGKSAVIESCSAKVSLSVAKKPYTLSTGAVVGENRGAVKFCHSEGSLSAVSDKYRINLGGIVGENKGSVEGCYNNAAVDGTVGTESAQIFAGGIVGFNNNGSVIRTENFESVSGTGVTVYPAYAGGVTGVNLNGYVSIAKNSTDITASKAFVGGIAGFSIGHGGIAKISDIFNFGNITAHDSVIGGLVAENTKTEKENSGASLGYALNISTNKAVGENGASASVLYSTGEDDGVSTAANAADMKTDGIAELEERSEIWVNNIEAEALPDMLVVYDISKPALIPSNKGDSGDVAYYFYNPEDGIVANSFTAAYYNGAKYIGMKYIERTPDEPYARLLASEIPEGTTRIKFIVFSHTFSDGFKPAPVKSVEIEYTK